MINLLPSQSMENIMYARRNTRLLKWVLSIIVAIIGVAAIVGTGHLILSRSAKQVAKQVEAGKEQLKQQKLEETQNKVEDISSSLRLATQVLSRQVVFSELIPQIGAVLPAGTALAGLQINKIEGGIDLSVAATDYQTATQVQVNLADADNRLFEKADIININCGNSDDSRYPCEASLRALFVKDHPYNFLNQGGS